MNLVTLENPAICGLNLITTEQPKSENASFVTKDQPYTISIKQVKVIDAKNDIKSLLFFLNNRFRNVMSEAGYSEIGRTGKYFNIKHKR